jgi:hypothetical protein
MDTHYLHVDGRTCVLGERGQMYSIPALPYGPAKQTGGIASPTFFILLLLVLVSAAIGYVTFKRYERGHVIAVNNFENPVYRHTTINDDDQLYFDHALNDNGSSSRGGGGGASSMLQWVAPSNTPNHKGKHQLVLSDDDDLDELPPYTPQTYHNGAVVYTDNTGGSSSMNEPLTENMA